METGVSPQGCWRGSVVSTGTQHDPVHKGCHHMLGLSFLHAKPDDLTWRVSTMSQALPPIAPTAYILSLDVIPLKQVWYLSQFRTLIWVSVPEGKGTRRIILKGGGEKNFLKMLFTSVTFQGQENNLLTQEVTNLILKTVRRPELPCHSEINGELVFSSSQVQFLGILALGGQ